MTTPRIILPSHDELHWYFTYDEYTGILKWKNSYSNKIKTDDIAGWKCCKSGHLAVTVRNKSYLVHRIIWKMMLDEEPPEEIDHKDTNPTNNKWENLRESLRRENMANSKLSIANNSGFKGVGFHKSSGLWRARIMIDYKDIIIGYFKTKEEAALARKNYAIKIHGEFARESGQ